MIVEELRQVVEHVQQQPADVQRQIAAVIARELEEREWEILVQTAESQQVLTRLAAEARAEMATDKTRDLDELL